MKWNKVRLDDLCKMNSGGTPSRSNLSFYTGNIPWAKISDIENAEGGIIQYTEEHITKEGLASINNRLFDKGTLLLAMYGSVGKVAFAGMEMTTNQAILGIKIKDENILSYSFLKYWFQTIKEQLLNRAVGGTLQNISLGIVKDLQIPLPPLPIQKRIAQILDAADALKRKDQQLLKKYDELAQAIFIDMFGDPVKNEKGWNFVKFDDVCNKITDGEHQTPKRTQAGIKLLSARNIQNGYLTFDNGVDYIPIEEHERISKRCNPEYGDILLSCSGSVGRVSMYRSYEKISLVRSVALLKPNNDLINSTFFEFAISSDYVQNQITKNAHQSSQANIFTGQIKSLNLFLPSIKLQNEFESKVKLVSDGKNELTTAFKSSNNLFNSLIQKAFNGQLVHE